MNNQVEPTSQDDSQAAQKSSATTNAPTPAMTQEQAALAVMHPDSYDADWRYYHGAWG